MRVRVTGLAVALYAAVGVVSQISIPSGGPGIDTCTATCISEHLGDPAVLQCAEQAISASVMLRSLKRRTTSSRCAFSGQQPFTDCICNGGPDERGAIEACIKSNCASDAEDGLNQACGALNIN